jgi:hypothetical protein
MRFLAISAPAPNERLPSHLTRHQSSRPFIRITITPASFEARAAATPLAYLSEINASSGRIDYASGVTEVSSSAVFISEPEALSHAQPKAFCTGQLGVRSCWTK